MPNKSVLCLTGKRSQTEQILHNLTTAGFFHEDISILFLQGFSLVDHGFTAADPLCTHPGSRELTLEGSGPFTVAGPILEGLNAAITSGVADTIAVTLIGMGHPETEAHRIEEKIIEGKALVAVNAEDRADLNDIEETFRQAGAQEICVMGTWHPRIHLHPCSPQAHSQRAFEAAA